jgi:hypothetical protein
MQTMIELLATDAAGIKDGITALMACSSLSREPDHNGEGLVYFNLSGNHSWNALDIEGKRIQTRVLENYRHYRDFVQALIRGLPEDGQGDFEDANSTVLTAIEQQVATWAKSPGEAKIKTLAAIDQIQGLLNHLYSPEGETMVVADTNALLYAPALEHWSFDWCEQFTLILMPTVLSELDKLKIEHRNPDVRAKAERLVRQFKEFLRRGDLLDGVPIVKGRITARSMAVEPRFAQTLPWLDPANNDDRLLASVVELIRQNVRTTIALVTGDINLQNKASYARIPVVEPPELRAAS